MSNLFRRLVSLTLVLLLVACGGTGTVRSNNYSRMLGDYGAAIRWGEFDAAWGYVDPAYREQHPLTDLDRERFKLIQVTGYDVRSGGINPEGILEQTVEIRVVGKFTQSERTVVDHQRWRWDEAGKRWWLLTGLPDFNAP